MVIPLTMFTWAAAGAGHPSGSLQGPDLDRVQSDLESLTGLFARVYAADPSNDPIVGGTAVGDSQPNVVALAGFDPYSGETYVFCSGSQIADDWVLTAAHCVLSLGYLGGLQPYVLYGGNVMLGGYTDAVPWADFYANPSYDGAAFTNDGGVVHLAEPRPDVQWMVLNDTFVDKTFVGRVVTFYGYGITSDTANDAGLLRTTQIPITAVDPFNISTYAAGTNVCSGDSGGPSTYDGPDGPEQIGINAFVTPGCVGGSAGSTRVDTQLGFIRSHVTTFATDYDQLPRDEVESPTGPTRDWLDLGVEDGIPGFDVRGDGVSTSGCSQIPGGAGIGACITAGAMMAAGLRRRSRPPTPRTLPRSDP